MRTEEKLIRSSGLVKILLFGSSLITLSFWTKFADPFNPLKLILILFVAFWSLGHLIVDRNQVFKNHELKIPIVLILMFLTSLLIVTLNSDVKQVAWLGDYQRNNGYLFYLGLCIVLVALASYFKVGEFRLLSNVSLMLGLVTSIYGLFQISGKDFVQWNNPYNAIISTVGNPNFAGAILATMGVLTFGFALSNLKNRYRLTFNLLTVLLICITIYLSEARQGVIGFLIGFSFIVGVFLYSRSKLIGRIFFILASTAGIFAVLGMLQTGPLAPFLYKGSVTVRGYYWRAGIRMFLDHPWLGVGTDYYGGFFKEYREAGYPLNYGYEITSSNAHNVFIQIFSTAGLFVGTTYLLITLYIFWRGITRIRRSHLDHKMYITTTVGAWLTLQSISVISIDSPGVTIWSWVLGGIILSLDRADNYNDASRELRSSKIRSTKKNPKQTLISSLLIVPVFFLSINIFKVESDVQTMKLVYNPKAEENSTYLRSIAQNISRKPTLNSIQMAEIASLVATSGFSADGIEILNYAISKDSRNLDAINLLARYYEELNQLEMAINLRLRIIELDPYNAKNYYQLGIIYKTLGDFVSMEKMQKMILSFAKDTPEGAAALKDLVP